MVNPTAPNGLSAGGLIARFVVARPALMASAMAVTVLSCLAEIAFPWLLQQGVDAAVGEPTGWTVREAALAMMVTIGVIAGGHALTLVFESLMFASASFDLRRRLYRHLELMPLAALTRHRTGSLAYRATSDVAALEASIVELFGDFLFDLLVAAGAIAAMMMTDVRLTLIVMIVMIAATAVGGYFGEKLPVYKRAAQMLSARLAGRLQESLAGVRTVRALGAEDHETARLDAVNRKIQGIDIRGGMLRALVMPLWHFAEALGIVAVLWYGGSLVAAKAIGIGSLVGFIAYQQLLSGPLNRCGHYYFQFQASRGVAGRIASLLTSGLTPALAPGQPREGAAADGDFAFERVSFQYPGTTRPILRDVSFLVTRNEHVALIGRNGAGKSSVLDLAMGFHVPDSGRIHSGGHELSETDPRTWRTDIGLMLQDTVLFHGTLGENLAVAAPGAPPERLTGALLEAGGQPLLARLTKGLDTVIGERGQTLSGGERQIVGLARLILKDPRIILLDEPTAHLDGAILASVITAIERFTAGRTLILITHHPEVLRLASRGIVLDEGRVIADGPLAALERTVSLYRDLTGRAAPITARDRPSDVLT